MTIERKKSIKSLMRTLPEQHYVISASMQNPHEDFVYIAMQKAALKDLENLIAQLSQIPSSFVMFHKDYLSRAYQKVDEIYHEVDAKPGIYLQEGKRAIERRLKTPEKSYGVLPARNDE